MLIGDEDKFNEYYKKNLTNYYFTNLLNTLKNTQLRNKLSEVLLVFCEFEELWFLNFTLLQEYYVDKYFYQKYIALAQTNNFKRTEQANYFVIDKTNEIINPSYWEYINEEYPSSIENSTYFTIDSLDKYYFLSNIYLRKKSIYRDKDLFNFYYDKDINYIRLDWITDLKFHEEFWNIPSGLIDHCFMASNGFMASSCFILDLSEFNENYKNDYKIAENIDFYIVGNCYEEEQDYFTNELYLFQILSTEKCDFFEKFKLFRTNYQLIFDANKSYVYMYGHHKEPKNIITNLRHKKIHTDSFKNFKKPQFKKIYYHKIRKEIIENINDLKISSNNYPIITLLEINEDKCLANWIESSELYEYYRSRDDDDDDDNTLSNEELRQLNNDAYEVDYDGWYEPID